MSTQSERFSDVLMPTTVSVQDTQTLSFYTGWKYEMKLREVTLIAAFWLAEKGEEKKSNFSKICGGVWIVWMKEYKLFRLIQQHLFEFST